MSSVLDHLLSLPAVWVYLVVALLVFAEDAVFVGFVIPGETAALLIGVDARFGHVDLVAATLVVVVAAIVGDSVGYEVGRKVGARVLATRFLRRRATRTDAARDLLARRGGAAVFLGRFVAFFRAVMPALAGTAHMPYARFLRWNALGGTAWGVAFVLIGYLAGASYQAVAGTVGTWSAVIAAAVVVVLLVVWRLRRRRREQAVAPTAAATGPRLRRR